MRQHRPCYGRDAASPCRMRLPSHLSDEVLVQYAAVLPAPGSGGTRIYRATVVVHASLNAPRKSSLGMATTGTQWSRSVPLFVGALGALAVKGYATLTNDGGFSTMRAMIKERTGHEVRRARTEAEREAIKMAVREMLARPLSVDDAVRIALINTRGLRVPSAGVGIGETELVQASSPRNPGFAFSHLRGGRAMEIECSFTGRSPTGQDCRGDGPTTNSARLEDMRACHESRNVCGLQAHWWFSDRETHAHSIRRCRGRG